MERDKNQICNLKRFRRVYKPFSMLTFSRYCIVIIDNSISMSSFLMRSRSESYVHVVLSFRAISICPLSNSNGCSGSNIWSSYSGIRNNPSPRWISVAMFAPDDSKMLFAREKLVEGKKNAKYITNWLQDLTYYSMTGEKDRPG